MLTHQDQRLTIMKQLENVFLLATYGKDATCGEHLLRLYFLRGEDVCRSVRSVNQELNMRLSGLANIHGYIIMFMRKCEYP